MIVFFPPMIAKFTLRMFYLKSNYRFFRSFKTAKKTTTAWHLTDSFLVEEVRSENWAHIREGFLKREHNSFTWKNWAVRFCSVLDKNCSKSIWQYLQKSIQYFRAIFFFLNASFLSVLNSRSINFHII